MKVDLMSYLKLKRENIIVFSRLKLEWYLSCWVFTLLFLMISSGSPIQAGEIITSPDGKIEVNCNLYLNQRIFPNEIRFYYNIRYKETQILQDSPLTIEFKRDKPFSGNYRLYKTKRISTDKIYSYITGTQKTVRDHYNQITFSMQEKEPPFRLIDIIFRVANDGVAFRYHIPNQTAVNELTITSENSLFHFADDFKAYPLILKSFTTPYEDNYQTMSVTSIPLQSLTALPLLLDTGQGPWIAITEASLIDYAGMYLTRMENFPLALKSCLSPLPSDTTVKVIAKTPIKTPWRVILIGETPGKLIESNFILNLNDSCAIMDPSWIKPGRCVWLQ